MSDGRSAIVFKKLHAFLGSQLLACALLSLLFVLTFLGTIEQTQSGLYEVQKKYFESAFLVYRVGGVVPIPLPGAYLVLGLLGLNLIIGGIVRVRFTRQKLGVLR